MGRPVNLERRQERQDAFLAAFERTGILKRAAEESGVIAQQHHKWVKDDPEYAARFTEAAARAQQSGLAKENRKPHTRGYKQGGERGQARDRNQERLLEALNRLGIAADAAAEIGIAKETYNYWMRSDEHFAERAREAFRAGRQQREQTIFERRSRAGHAAWADPERRSEWARRQRQEFWTPERRAAWGPKVSEIARTPGARAARSTAGKRQWENPEARQRHAETMRQRWADPEYSAKMRATMSSPEVRQRISDAAKAKWAQIPPEQRKARLKSMRTTLKGGYRLTKIESAVMTVLNERGLPYFVHKQVDRYVADLLVPSLNLIIECDGAYYHSLRNGTDETRDAALLALGYETLRLSEAEIIAKDWTRLDEAIARPS